METSLPQAQTCYKLPMFEPVRPQVSFPELDARQMAFWRRERIFERSVAQREGGPSFVFYEGPPTANGLPHPGHVLTRVVKDLFLRYKTMCGHHVPRRAGWDTHGLPVEVEVEKELGLSGGPQSVEAYGVERYTRRCMESVFRYIDEWKRMTERIGFWIDLEDAYVTFHEPYVESVWWALRRLFEQGLLYQDYKVVWWWPQGGTALSAGEVGQGYRTVDDPSIVVRFPLRGEERTSLLAWTTTPWTLPSHVALAVDPSTEYAVVRTPDGERLILAAALRESVLAGIEHELERTTLGRDLLELRYEPPFRYAEPRDGDAFLVVAADFVTLEQGTGIVHLAPAFGEDDFRVARQGGLGFLQLVRPDGTFPPEVTDFAGRFCKEADRDIIRHLRARGLLLREQTYRHEYPFCWRKDTDPLIQYARKSWYIRTTREMHRVVENNAAVRWEPEHIRGGRMGSFLRSNVDWALSRERTWGTPLPIWVNDETGRMECIGSVAEILERNPRAFEDFERARAEDPSLSEHLRVHRPWIDRVTWTRPGEPGVYRRVPEVIDCWFDSGCMPFAQWGYPHRGHEAFERAFPADFVTEAVDQTRGWFYSLMTIATLLFPDREPPRPFRSCVVLGLITDEKGQKLSKSKRNYSDPLELMERHGADAVRWMLYSGTVPGQSTRFSERAVQGALREFVLKLWNVYGFFVTYANIDRWDPRAPRVPLAERPAMDRWILAELDATVRQVRRELDDLKGHLAARHLQSFVESLSNWYVRRSRARFWAEETGTDKLAAFATLYETLLDLARLLAPFTPFLAEAMYRNLARGTSALDSVHLEDYPRPFPERADESLREAMEAVRHVVALGQRVRTEARRKVRQPLAEAIVVVADEADRRRIARFESAVREELNVERLTFAEDPSAYVTMRLLPDFRRLGPRLGKRMKAAQRALAAADPSVVRTMLAERGRYELTLEDEEPPIVLAPEDVQVRFEPKGEFAAAAEGSRLVVLDTHVDARLRRAGLAREATHRLQQARKRLDLPYEARIEVRWQAEGGLAEAIEEHAEAIAAEVLALSFERGAPHGEERFEERIDEETFRFSVSRR